MTFTGQQSAASLFACKSLSSIIVFVDFTSPSSKYSSSSLTISFNQFSSSFPIIKPLPPASFIAAFNISGLIVGVKLAIKEE